MTETPNLALPLVIAAQAQKEVTLAEAMLRIDGLLMLAIEDRDLSDPPASPLEGQRWLVGPAATGAWAGQEGQIALWASGWEFVSPRAGFIAHVLDEGGWLAFDGVSWLEVPIAGGAADFGSLSVSGEVTLTGLPTSATGLPVGAVWNDGGVLKVV